MNGLKSIIQPKGLLINLKHSINWSVVEITGHLILWVFIMASIHVNWTSNWFDQSAHHGSIAPLTILLFPLVCYIHGVVLIPKFLKQKKWLLYLCTCFIVFIMPEILRSFMISSFSNKVTFYAEFTGRDSFVFGILNPIILAFQFSFFYKITKDWLIYNYSSKQTKGQIATDPKQKEKIQPLKKEEAVQISQQLEMVLKIKKPYLDPNIKLRDLANQIGSTEKKLSYFLNHHLKIKFYDYLNQYRIEAFKYKIGNNESNHLSMEGLAHECGFKSKSSFYRAFKKRTGLSPSNYIKQNHLKPPFASKETSK